MSPSSSRTAPLSIHRSFVVQFRADTRLDTGPVTGCVEHVVSRQTLQFHSLDALLAFFAQVLHEGQAPSSRRRPDARCSHTGTASAFARLQGIQDVGWEAFHIRGLFQR